MGRRQNPSRLSELHVFFLERLVAPVRPQIFFSRTSEKIGRMCDQIGRTLEPCKSLHAVAPQYLTDLLHIYHPSRDLRSADLGLLSIPRTRRQTFGSRAFSVVAPTLWNSLPQDIRQAPTLDNFKSLLKRHLFLQAFAG